MANRQQKEQQRQNQKQNQNQDRNQNRQGQEEDTRPNAGQERHPREIEQEQR